MTKTEVLSFYHLTLLCQTNIFRLHTRHIIWHYIKQKKYGMLEEWFLLIVIFISPCDKKSGQNPVNKFGSLRRNLLIYLKYWFQCTQFSNIFTDGSVLFYYPYSSTAVKIIKTQIFKLFQINIFAKSLTTNLVRQCFVGKNIVKEISSAVYIMQNSSSPCYIYIRGILHSRNVKSCIFVSELTL